MRKGSLLFHSQSNPGSVFGLLFLWFGAKRPADPVDWQRAGNEQPKARQSVRLF